MSEAILGAGFRDTYREIHPDPIAEPGITHQGVGDRIDYLYARRAFGDHGQPAGRRAGRSRRRPRLRAVDFDHRALVSTFEFTPARMQTMVSASPALLTQGDPLMISYHAPSATGTVDVVAAGGEVDAPVSACRVASDVRLPSSGFVRLWRLPGSSGPLDRIESIEEDPGSDAFRVKVDYNPLWSGAIPRQP